MVRLLAVHTIADHGTDCFYGWNEPIDRTDCKPHRVIGELPEDVARWLAIGLLVQGHQVVVTEDADWSSVVPGYPRRYVDTHSH